MVGIYKITSPTKKVYIGQSINIERRFKEYEKLKCKNQIALYNSFLKYGFDKHKIDLLCECEVNELNDKERFYQDIYDATGKNGLNCSLTKSSDRSGKHSEETRKKISEANEKRKRGNEERSEEFKNKLKVANLKRFDETPEKSWWKYMPKEYFENMRKHFL